MSTSLDLRLVPKVSTIVSRFGTTATILQPDGETYDPKTGAVTIARIIERTVKVTPPSNYGLDLVNGDTIKIGDCRVILAAQGLVFTPQQNWGIRLGSETWTIISVGPIRTGDDVAAYELQLRR